MIGANDLWIVASTAWGEARGEGEAGMAAVVHVLLNRAHDHRWSGLTLAQICQQKAQFSVWLPSDPNRHKLDQLTLADADFVTALLVAVEVLSGEREDSTQGSTHDYADSIPAPAWARGHSPVAHIGHHLFFTGIA